MSDTALSRGCCAGFAGDAEPGLPSPGADDARRLRRGEDDGMAQRQALRSRPPTAFERRVYAVVRRIPRGEVRSYQWVARQLGSPKLARAVGQALKWNPCPERTPCHRVVRSDGSLGGYAWGVAKKRRLLRQESPSRLKTGILDRCSHVKSLRRATG